MRQTRFRFPVTTLAGSRLKNINALLDGHSIDPAFRNKLRLTKIVAGIFEPFSAAEQMIRGGRIKSLELKYPPVFIIGFWRSGTTLLHNLLCQDPEAAYTTTFQTVFPGMTLSQSWWLKPFTNRFLPEHRPYDNVSMDMNFPQEEDFGMMNLQPSTIYKFFIFPKDFDRIVDEELFTGNLPPHRIVQWERAYRSMIAKAVFNTGGSRYIGKNPCHLTRIGLLLKMYPDAKFIFIHRHPYNVIESLYHFILSIFPGVQLQQVPADFSRHQVVDLYKRSIEAYLHDRSMIPRSNLVEISMQDFLKDCVGNLQMMYSRLELGDFGRAASSIHAFLEKNDHPPHPADPPTPETIRLVDQHLGGIMESLDYSKK